jgi:hypothetical protein
MEVFLKHRLGLDDLKLGSQQMNRGIAAATRLARTVKLVHVFKFFSVAAPMMD